MARSLTSVDLPGLSVVIPAYNEASSIRAGVLSQVRDFLHSYGLPFEVLIVDDGSLDETAELVRAFATAEPGFRLLELHHGGKAHAVVHGLLAARGQIVLSSDMDQAIPIQQASKVLPWFSEGFDIVVGSRGLERQHARISRRLISYGQLLARYAILRFADIVDTQCGFKAFRREIIEPLIDGLVVHGAAREAKASGSRLSPGFEVELLFTARRKGLSIKEVPIECDHRRGTQTNPFRDCVDGLSDLLAIRAAARQGRYDVPLQRSINESVDG
jgi:dolichyl-phosphate beta-glucosyltransferase